MKKNTLIIAVIVLILISVGSSGCTQQPGNTDNNGQASAIEIDMFETILLSNNYNVSVVFYCVAHGRVSKNLTYEVDTGESVYYNGQVTPVIGHGHKCTHTYYKWGTNYTAQLIVRDDIGNENYTLRTIHIGTPSVEPLYFEHNTNPPEMNGITYAEQYALYGITSISYV
jgi:hypothetical protein